MAEGSMPREGAASRLAPAPTGRLSLTELVPPGQIDLRCDAADPRIARALGQVLPCLLPTQPNTLRSAAEVTILRLGPDEWLLLTPPGAEHALAAGLRQALSGLHAAVTDVSGARAAFQLSGANARETLQKGCGLDLHPRAFGPGRCAQTLLARTGVILHRLDEAPSYGIMPRRSYAEYLWLWLADAMAEYAAEDLSYSQSR